MKTLRLKQRMVVFFNFLFIVTSVLLVSCSDPDTLEIDALTGGLGDFNVPVICDDPAEFIFQEKEGLVNVEFENAIFSEDWELTNSDNDHTGEGYMVWNGNQSLANPGNGLTSFKMNITNTGTYRFLWRSSVVIGDSGTDHNDTWLRFNDASDFFGEQNGGSIVYPAGTGKTPNPEGASSDGWFKIYRSGNDLSFKWQASTSDSDAHNIYVKFDNVGIYTMEISARSSGHAIDRFVLFNDTYTINEATDTTNSLSEITCTN